MNQHGSSDRMERTLPDGWEVRQLRRLARTSTKQLPNSTPPEYSFRYLDIGSVGQGKLREEPEWMIFRDAPSRARKRVNPGDVIISTVRTYLRSVMPISEDLKDAIVSTGFAVFTPNASTSSRWLGYAMQSSGFIDEVVRRSNGVAYPGTTDGAIARTWLSVPPHHIQLQIAQFLDSATARIDEAIAAKKRLIELLGEESHAVISEAVLGRLTSPNGLVASPLAWAPTLPAPWDLRRIKVVLNERSHKGYPDLPLLAATQSKGVIRKEDYETRTVVAQKDLHLLKLVEVGDFVISLRSFQGGIERAHHRGIISPAYTVLYARDPEVQDFLTYLFKSRPFLELLRLNVTGIREGQNIDYSRLGRELIPIPPTEEQARIVRYLDDATARLSDSITIAERQIELLEEYRTALIADAVTGKLDLSAADSRQLDTVAEEAVEAALAGEPA